MMLKPFCLIASMSAPQFGQADDDWFDIRGGSQMGKDLPAHRPVPIQSVKRRRGERGQSLEVMTRSKRLIKRELNSLNIVEAGEKPVFKFKPVGATDYRQDSWQPMACTFPPSQENACSEIDSKYEF